MQQEQSGGYVFRDAEGSLYLIRDEVLEACKIDGADLRFAREIFEPSNVDDGVPVESGPFRSYARIDDTCATHPNEVCPPRPAPPSTIMCGW